jgi:hypothetical protein
MSKGKKILNYAAMACAIMAIIVFYIDKNWDAVIWAIIALIWIVNCHLAEDTCYGFKESLDKLTDDYCNTLIKHGKEVKELRNEIEKLNKGQ